MSLFTPSRSSRLATIDLSKADQSQYSFKLKSEAAEQGSAKHKTLSHQGINYLYRCESPFPLCGKVRSGVRMHSRVDPLIAAPQ